MQFELDRPGPHLHAYRCRCRRVRSHSCSHKPARPAGRRRLGANAVKPRLPASRMPAPTRQRAHRHVVRLCPRLGLLPRCPIRRHPPQAVLHLLSIHSPPRLVDYRDTRFAASQPRRKMGSRNVHGRPRFAKLSIDDGSKVKIAPVHSDFRCGFLAAVPDGICWLAPRSLTRTLGASSGTGFANHGLTCFAITS